MLGAVTFHLPGMPQGKGRPRAFKRGEHVGMFTPEKTRSYEGAVRLAAEKAMEGRTPIEGAVTVSIVAVFPVPKSGFSKARRAAALAGAEFPAKRPDLDNIAKAITDSANAIVYKDDAQIVCLNASKIYGERPMVMVAVTPL